MEKDKKQKVKKVVRVMIVFVLAIGMGFYYFGVIRAGSLSPSAAPAGTFRTLGEVYNALFSTSTSFSSLSASSSGSAIQISKCAINKLEGIPCN